MRCLEEITALARSKNWESLPFKPESGLASFFTRKSRIDIYITKMTAVVSHNGRPQIVHKKQTIGQIESLFTKYRPESEKKNKKFLGMIWNTGLPKEAGYYCLNKSIIKYYFDGLIWFRPRRNEIGGFVRKVTEVKTIKNHSKIEHTA